ncbi:pyridoxamine 5'-phosphate oxidase family protein [Geomesophilobacter sediminis]|uniref:Pyridoxamine 5'-phosphate oxidase family protein n=1 Tax=Geomesophilobacter sediminis TaxID=2798584 RepID=A0A8J7S9X2_9BACT|nr:pyridoxamine 5'-phosphate oxidase family protein [Geomesophilobacter sediminis]MBJ6727120.1 pyridoxamine 5'-phosphate oxidase family protein [Geomesophilobacter sediminis]
METKNERVRRQVNEYLQGHNVATLATCSDGKVWAAAVFYVWDGATLYFLSAPASRHAADLARNPQVALTVQEDYADWPEIKGVQLEGVASELSGAEEARARRLYGEKFPAVGIVGKVPATLVKALAKVRWYQVVPQHLYFIDNSKGFGHRDEVLL